MASSLSNLVDNITEEIQKIKCTNCYTCCREYTKATDNLIEEKYLCCNKNTYKLANHDITKFTFLLQKGVYS